MMDSEAIKTVKPPRNWWKLAFFVTLIAFEIAREVAVIETFSNAQPNGSGYVDSVMGNLVTAEGSWKRIDGGGSLMPGVVRIECWKDRGTCIEASTTIFDNHVAPPEIDVFNSTFTKDAVTYENDFPDCVTYSVRIDLLLNKAFAVRQRKEPLKKPICNNLEPRLEMQLARSSETRPDQLAGHFLPLFQALAAVGKLFAKN